MQPIPKLRNMTALYFICDNQMLLLYRQGSRVVNDVWIGSAGGHVEQEELNDPEACVLRELREELALEREDIQNLELRYITLRYVNGEIRQNYYFFAEIPEGMKRNLTSTEGELAWFPMEVVKDLPMPYTAKYVVEHYLSIGRHSHALYGGIADGAQVTFTEIFDS